MRLFYGKGANRKGNGNLPPLELKNMYLEATPANDEGAVLLSRKGLSEHANRGSGPIRGIFQQSGVFSGDQFVLSGSTLYRGATSLGTVAGAGPVSFAASSTELAICAGGTLYRYDPTATPAFAAVSFPDSASVRKILFHDGLFLAARDGGQRFYFSAVLDADTWGALDFASAERQPDPLLDMAVVNDTLWLFGSSTIEPWANTGDAELPYQRFEQRLITKGMYSTGCVVDIDNTLAWVGNDCIAYRLGDVPERISDHFIEERIAASDAVSCFAYIFEGHSFFCVRLDGETFAFDLATGQWSELSTLGRDNFRGRCAVTVGADTYLGDDETGKVWTLDGWEDGGDELERVFTVAAPLTSRGGPIDSLEVIANTGSTGLLSGQGSDPVIEMRQSRDGGRTWLGWRSEGLGAQGVYDKRVRWNRLGQPKPPGFLAQFRVTDPVPLRISAVTANEEL
jgi:hypothetical protein